MYEPGDIVTFKHFDMHALVLDKNDYSYSCVDLYNADYGAVNLYDFELKIVTTIFRGSF